ncbi:TPA: conjugal transfer pilus-stabilizing protein TraP [Escherichia coli]
MASINTIVKRKQYLWLGIVVVGTASAIGGALYLSDVDMSGNGETVAEQEPVPDMTGVVDICHYRAADAADYVRETDRSLMQLVTAFWATLALMYMSFAAGTGKYPVLPGKMKCIRVVTADEYLKDVYTEDASLPGKIRKCHVYFPDDRTNRSNGDKNEHA